MSVTSQSRRRSRGLNLPRLPCLAYRPHTPDACMYVCVCVCVTSQSRRRSRGLNLPGLPCLATTPSRSLSLCLGQLAAKSWLQRQILSLLSAHIARYWCMYMYAMCDCVEEAVCNCKFWVYHQFRQRGTDMFVCVEYVIVWRNPIATINFEYHWLTQRGNDTCLHVWIHTWMCICLEKANFIQYFAGCRCLWALPWCTVHTYLYAYIHMYTQIHAYTFTNIHTCIHTHVGRHRVWALPWRQNSVHRRHTRMQQGKPLRYACLRICMYVSTYTHRGYARMLPGYIYIYIYIHVYIYIYIYIYIISAYIHALKIPVPIPIPIPIYLYIHTMQGCPCCAHTTILYHTHTLERVACSTTDG
jgi:hypothetical protein